MQQKDYQKRYRSGLTSGKLFAIAGGVFACAIGVSVTSTYALYSISEQFRIVGFEMQISHEEELFKLGKKEDSGEISYQGDTPYFLKDLGVVNPVVGNVSNMSVDSYPSTYSETFKPTFSSGYGRDNTTRMTPIAVDPAVDPEHAEYVQFELYAYCEYDAFLFLTPETGAVANTDANRETAVRKGIDVRVLDNVVNAARISFYTPMGYTIAELGEHEDVTYSGLLDLRGSGYFDTDEEGKEIVYGSYTGTPSYESNPLAEDEDPYEEHDIFHAAHKKGARKWNPDASYGAKKEVAYPVSHYAMDIDNPDMVIHRPSPIGVAKAKTPTRIVVSVFLEGWDHDMTSSLIEASFGLNLGFVAEFNPAAGDYFK